MANLAPIQRKDLFQNLRDEIEGAFGRWLPVARGRNGDDFFAPFEQSMGAPAVEVKEDENEITVRAEVPGLEKDDLKVEVVGDRLTIRGEKKSTKEEKKRDYWYSECRYGSFARTIGLPSEVNADKVEAKLRNGVLELRLPKAETSKARKIPVKVV